MSSCSEKFQFTSRNMSTESEEQRTIAGRCDICNQRDRFNDHNLQQCVACGVLVHETCNGMPSAPNFGKLENWTCLACQSIGQTFRARQQLGHLSDNCWDDDEVKQEERPTACALCSVRSGCHAMHPLYDMPGSMGRQVVNKSGKLVWVHTLCGMYHAVHTGMVYGCDEHGNYDDSNIEEVVIEEDGAGTEKVTANDSIIGSKVIEFEFASPTTNSVIGSKVIDFEFASPPPVIEDEPSNVESKPSLEEEEEAVSVTATAWFVIGGKETGKWAEWARQTRTNISNARKDVCCFCKHPDNVPGCMRIPVLCSAGSSDEPKALSCRRKNGNDRCAVAMHVGCARWALTQKGKHAGKKSKSRRNFFTPGKEAGSSNISDEGGNNTKEKEIAKPAVACYCFKHAKEIQEARDRKKRLEERKRKHACLEEDECSEEEEEETKKRGLVSEEEENGDEETSGSEECGETSAQQMEEDADSSDDDRSLEYKPPGSTRALGFSADDEDGDFCGGGEADASTAEKGNPWASIWKPGGKNFEVGDWNASDVEDQVDI